MERVRLEEIFQIIPKRLSNQADRVPESPRVLLLTAAERTASPVAELGRALCQDSIEWRHSCVPTTSDNSF